MPKSYYLAQAILDHITDNTAYTPASDLYLALYTTAPTQSGGGTEVSGTSYARQVIAFGAANSSGVATNSGTITFPSAGSNWGTVVAVGIFDALTDGNLLGYDYLSQARAIYTGDTIIFNIGEISWEES